MHDDGGNQPFPIPAVELDLHQRTSRQGQIVDLHVHSIRGQVAGQDNRKAALPVAKRQLELHRMSSAVSAFYGHLGPTQAPHECSRLVGNAVVYYNALILSEALAELESRGEWASVEVLKRVSPVAWQHINFYGRYRFDADFTPINLAELRKRLSSEEVSRL